MATLNVGLVASKVLTRLQQWYVGMPRDDRVRLIDGECAQWNYSRKPLCAVDDLESQRATMRQALLQKRMDMQLFTSPHICDEVLSVIYPQGLGMNKSGNKRAKTAQSNFRQELFHALMSKPAIRLSKTLLALSVFSLISCAPQREFVQFEDAGTFHPGPGQGNRRIGPPSGEYDSYELIDNGAPNQGIAPMYQGYQQPAYGGDYPAVQQGFDQYGNPVNVVVPRPW